MNGKVLLIIFGVGWIGYVLSSHLGIPVINEFLSNCIFGCLSATSISIYFMQKVPFVDNKLNKVATATFGIYLFHENALLREVLWEKVFHVATIQFQSAFFLIEALLTIGVIFIGGFLMEQGRVYLFGLVDSLKSNHIVSG